MTILLSGIINAPLLQTHVIQLAHSKIAANNVIIHLQYLQLQQMAKQQPALLPLILAIQHTTIKSAMLYQLFITIKLSELLMV